MAPAILSVLFAVAAVAQPKDEAHQDSIIAKYLKRGAWKHSMFSKEWHDEIDKGLAEDSTVAYLWQQKAMPLFKQRKYEYAMPFLDKAVQYDKHWLDYRAFMECIFAKQYRRALIDFEVAKKLNGDVYVMDHSYDFYRGLCYLQLNLFDSALLALHSEIEKAEREQGKGWVHFLDIFYLGVAYYELQDYDKAIATFERCLKSNPVLSDAKYYYGCALIRKGDEVKGKAFINEAREDAKEGKTINEDNAIYEPYPYQVNWKLVAP